MQSPLSNEWVIKKLSCVDAQKAFMKMQPLKYEVTAKFENDHNIVTAPVLSKDAAFGATIERYKRNQNLRESSWILVDKSTLKNRAANADKVAFVYAGAQQMAVAIKVEKRTVSILAQTRKEIQGHNPSDFEEVTIGTEKRYLTLKSNPKQDVTLCLKGPWNPFTGVVQLYHYEVGALPPCAMLDKYLRWKVLKNGATWEPEVRK